MMGPTATFDSVKPIADKIRKGGAPMSEAQRQQMMRSMASEALAMSPPALSRHLRVLKASGLVAEDEPEHDARVRLYRLQLRRLRRGRALAGRDPQPVDRTARGFQGSCRAARPLRRPSVKRGLRSIAAVMGGLLAWSGAATAGNLLLRALLVGYREAEPTTTFSGLMMVGRLALGVLASIACGLAARCDRKARPRTVDCGLRTAGLLCADPHHALAEVSGRLQPVFPRLPRRRTTAGGALGRTQPSMSAADQACVTVSVAAPPALGDHREAEHLATVRLAPLRVDPGDTHRYVAVLADAPSHRSAGFVVRFIDRLGRDDAALAAAPGILEAGQAPDGLASRVVSASTVSNLGGEVRQKAERTGRDLAISRAIDSTNERRQSRRKHIDRHLVAITLDAEERQHAVHACHGAVVRTHGQMLVVHQKPSAAAVVATETSRLRRMSTPMRSE